MICEPSLLPWHWAEQTGTDCPPAMPDWVMVGGDLGRANDLASIITMQLNTDKRSDGLRGWWGNQFQPFEIGSELWKLEGKPLNVQATIDAERYIQEALDPLAQQGLFETYSVTTRIAGSKLVATIEIVSPRGNKLYTRELVI